MLKLFLNPITPFTQIVYTDTKTQSPTIKSNTHHRKTLLHLEF